MWTGIWPIVVTVSVVYQAQKKSGGPKLQCIAIATFLVIIQPKIDT